MSNLSIVMAVIDLTSEKVEFIKQRFRDDLFEKYLGGIGFVVDYILNNFPREINPLGKENFLGFVPGILSGTRTPFSGRYTVVAKSPLTNTWGEANSGGRFGPALRRAGIDILLISGKASSLSTIYIEDGKLDIVSSDSLKGLDCIATETKLKQKYGSKVQVASIGLAGEKQVLLSGIVTDKGRIAARCGLGAVMGSKNLKAIVTNGTRSVPIHNPEGLRELRMFIYKRAKKGLNIIMRTSLKSTSRLSPWLRHLNIKNISKISSNRMIVEAYKRWGTTAATAMSVEIGDAPVKNWAGSYKDFPLNKSIKLTSDNVTAYDSRRYACDSCPVGCGGIITYKDDRYDLKEVHRPEYETLAMMGANLLNDDLGSIFALNDYCNREGVDTIAAGSILAFLIEGLEKGIITKKDLDGLSLEWGKADNYLAILKKLVSREGIGDILADGPVKLIERFGSKVEDIAIHVQNQFIPAHDPRYVKSQLIPYLIDPAPGRHTSFMEFMLDLSRFNKMYPELPRNRQKANFYYYLQLVTSLGLCEFGLTLGHLPVIDFVTLVTGIPYDIKDFLAVGERILTLKHLFNLREGINPLTFQLPGRIIGNPPATAGPHKNVSINSKAVIEDFLKEIRWNIENASPDKNRLKDLGLEQFIF